MDIKNLLHDDVLFIMIDRYKRQIGIAIVGLLCLLGLGYYWLNLRKIAEESAQSAFSELLHDFTRAQQNNELWPEIEHAAQTGYKQFSRSAYGPYFLALQAEALLRMDNPQESIVVFDKLLKGLSYQSPMYDLYSLKKIRVALDIADQEEQQSLLKQLISLANNKKSNVQDQALYYLGLYYAEHDQVESMRSTWQELIAAFGSLEKDQSPWALLAQQELQQGI